MTITRIPSLVSTLPNEKYRLSTSSIRTSQSFQDAAYDPELNPDGWCRMDVAQNWLMRDQHIPLDDFALTSKSHTYADGDSRFKKATARLINRHWKPVMTVEPQHLTLAKTSSALDGVLAGLVGRENGVLMGLPYDVHLSSTVVPVDFDGIDPLSLAAVHSYRRAMAIFEHDTGRRVRAIVLCNPHPSLGRCYPRSTIIGLMKLCQRYHLHLISDETQWASVWKNTIDSAASVPFASILSINTSGIIDRDRIHAIWGFSKELSFHPDREIRVGAIVSQSNRNIHSRLRRYSQTSITGPFHWPTTSLLENDPFIDRYLRLNSERVTSAFEYTALFLRFHRIPYRRGCHAGVFLWLDLGSRFQQLHPDEKKKDDFDNSIQQRLRRHRVRLVNSELNGTGMSGWFGFVFTHQDAYLMEALTRIVDALTDR